MKIVVGDYSSKEGDSLLARCEKVKSDYDGILHAGIIHYIQNKMDDFTLKAAISCVLDKCPSVWPEDLPERLDKGEKVPLTNAMQKEFETLNKNLLIPIMGGDIAQIIHLAKQFLAEHK